MSRKDYMRIAQIIKGSTHREIIDGTPKNEYSATIQKKGLIDGLVSFLKDDNPLFDAGKFISACN